jgi:hypothetical protein
MPMDTRRIFSELRVPKPEKTFLSYPSAPLLFHKMEPIQKEAVNALLGKGLVSQESIAIGRVELTDRGRSILPEHEMCTNDENKLSLFLATNFAGLEEAGNNTLRSRTGLRRPI